MCTAFTYQKGSLYFGRNMDIEYAFGEQVVITPRDYPISTKCCGIIPSHYAIIGMANVTDNYPLYAEAANEKGLCMAGLNFPSNAVYHLSSEIKKTAVTPYELILFVLGQCGSLSEAKALLSQIELVAIPFNQALPLAPLHWIVSDSSGSITVESTASGMHIYDNPYGVLTNNPPFPFHVENVRQFLHLSAQYPDNRFSQSLQLTPFGQGVGAIGIPGDFSPASRFIKTLFCKANSMSDDTENSCVAQVFHILDSVAMVRGTVITGEGRPDITTYSCCINASSGTYYYKTYENNQITKIQLTQERMSGKDLIMFPLRTQQQMFTE